MRLNRRVPSDTHGGVRGRPFTSRTSYSIASISFCFAFFDRCFAGKEENRLHLRRQRSFVARVGAQRLGDDHAAVSLQVVLQKRDEYVRRRDTGVVERICQLWIVVFGLVVDRQAARTAPS